MAEEQSEGEMYDQRKHLRLAEHLANERTFLAYLRSSLTLISFGITINRFSLFLMLLQDRSPGRRMQAMLIETERVAFGMILFGMVLLLWGAIHYTIVIRAIEREVYRPNPTFVWVTTTSLLAITLLTLVFFFRR
jgi:putative membrane protein